MIYHRKYRKKEEAKQEQKTLHLVYGVKKEEVKQTHNHNHKKNKNKR